MTSHMIGHMTGILIGIWMKWDPGIWNWWSGIPNGIGNCNIYFRDSNWDIGSSGICNWWSGIPNGIPEFPGSNRDPKRDVRDPIWDPGYPGFDKCLQPGSRLFSGIPPGTAGIPIIYRDPAGIPFTFRLGTSLEYPIRLLKWSIDPEFDPDLHTSMSHTLSNCLLIGPLHVKLQMHSGQ